VGSRQGPAAQSGVPSQSAGPEGLDFGGEPHVTELTTVVIVLASAGPAEKDVACGLHDTLARHHPEALMRIAALATRRLQHRPARFLDLSDFLYSLMNFTRPRSRNASSDW
jgi:hypothetical protein